MISYDLYSRERYLNSLDDNSLSSKRIFSSRDKKPNDLLSSSIIQAQSNLILNNSNGNINNKSINSYLYQQNPTIPSDYHINELNLSKESLEYDIKIASLKHKLQMLKEENKISKNNINIIKLRINKLINEEKVSYRDLENTKKRILKIKENREKNYYKKNSSKKNINSNLSSIRNNYFNNKRKSSKKSIQTGQGNRSQILLKLKNNLNSNSKKHKSFKINLNYKKFSESNLGLMSPKMGYFLAKKGINNSYDMIQENDDNCNYNEYKMKSSIFGKTMKKNNNKPYLKSKMKNNIIKKLQEDEEKKKKIEEEIREIEKEQYEMWINFNQNLNSGSTESNTNTNTSNEK